MVVWLVTEHFDGREGNRENVGAEYGDHECLSRFFVKHMALEFGPLVSILAEKERSREKNADTKEQDDGFGVGQYRMQGALHKKGYRSAYNVEQSDQHGNQNTSAVYFSAFCIDSFVVKHFYSSQNKSSRVRSSTLQILRHNPMVGL